jgi:signal transduction histidine kinase/CheY-like chemotaxis protein
MHKLLARQLRRHLDPELAASPALAPLLAAVEEAYRGADADRLLVERSMETVSRELTARMEHVRAAQGERDEVQRALSLLEAAIEGGDHAVLIVDLDGRVVRHSSNFVSLWPATVDALSRRDAEGVWSAIGSHLEDWESFEAARHVTESIPGRRDLTVRLRDGRRMELLAHPHRLQERTVGWVWRFRDVTERHHMESQLRHAHKMEAVGQIAGGIAHDFNNLLTSIRGNVSLLMSDASSADRVEHLNEIERASVRAAELTRQLLAYGRKQAFEVSTFELALVVDELEPMLRRILPASITLERSTHAAPVSADRGQLEQVVVSLALNARAAMPKGGTIAISCGTCEITEPRRDRHGDVVSAGRYAELCVRDTGVGMSASVLERIFEPFFSTMPLGQGSGLGLSMVYGIVRQSHGFIDVESELGQGTLVRLLLPIAEEVSAVESPRADATNERTAAASLESKRLTILLAEDEPSVRLFLRTILSRQGHAVLEAANGRIGVEVAAHFDGPIDLVVSDVLMPELGGPDMMRELRRTRPATRVLFISGYTDLQSLSERDLGAGQTRYLPKPFSTGQLMEAVRGTLQAP